MDEFADGRFRDAVSGLKVSRVSSAYFFIIDKHKSIMYHLNRVDFGLNKDLTWKVRNKKWILKLIYMIEYCRL